MQACMWETGKADTKIEVGQLWVAIHSGEFYVVTADMGYGNFDVRRESDGEEFRFLFRDFLGMRNCSPAKA